MIYYFAYGSNMDQKQMKQRCPGSVFIDSAILKDYKLAFTIYAPKRHCGAADIVNAPGAEVYGLLYTLTVKDLVALDGFEGHPNSYRRFTVRVINTADEKISAETYEVVNKATTHQKPSKDYLGKLITAAKAFNFSEEYTKNISQTETID